MIGLLISVLPLSGAAGKSAIDLLDERHYASGDISREEYLRAKNDILGKGL